MSLNPRGHLGAGSAQWSLSLHETNDQITTHLFKDPNIKHIWPEATIYFPDTVSSSLHDGASCVRTHLPASCDILKQREIDVSDPTNEATIVT